MGDGIIDETGSQAPEVLKAVEKEIKTIGNNVKKQYDELKTSYEELKKAVDKNSEDCLDHEKIIKLAEDVSARQEVLDKQALQTKKDIDERLDSIEVALKRLPSAGSGDPVKMQKEAEEFFKTALCVQSKDDKGATFDRIRQKEINIDKYRKYKEALEFYFRKDEKLISPEQFKALQVGIDPDGGYTVTPAMGAKIISKIYEMDPIRQLASVESITTNAIEWRVDWSEASSGWEEETVSGGESDTPTFSKKRIPVHIAYARPKVTQSLLDDSGINIEMWLAGKIADKIGRTEAAAFVTGNGIGKPRGFLTYDNGTNYGQVEQVVSGNATKPTADGLIDLKYSMLEYYLERGTFLMRRTTMAEILKLKYGNGEYIWSPGLQADDNSTILNLPVKLSPTMPAVAANALSIALADWKEAFMIVDRMGITVQRDPYTEKPFIEFYTRKRVGGDVVNYEAIKIQKISA